MFDQITPFRTIGLLLNVLRRDRMSSQFGCCLSNFILILSNSSYYKFQNKDEDFNNFTSIATPSRLWFRSFL